MIGKLIGAIAGAQAAKQSRKIGGVGGAVAGALAVPLLRRLRLPALVLLGAGAYAGKRLADKAAKAEKTPGKKGATTNSASSL